MDNVIICALIDIQQIEKLEYFAEKDKKELEDLALIAVDQYLKWCENSQNHSCCYKPPKLTSVTISIPSTPEINDKLRELANKEKLTLLHLVQHALHLYLEKRSSAKTACPHCGSEDYEVRNHNQDFHDGDIYCKNCGTYLRMFDAG